MRALKKKHSKYAIVLLAKVLMLSLGFTALARASASSSSSITVSLFSLKALFLTRVKTKPPEMNTVYLKKEKKG